jgi:phosphatidylglycerol:prolipoprotein diacylglycerol transferase
MFPTIHIGPAAIPSSGLIMILSIWIGLSVTERYSSRFHISPSQINSMVFLALAAGILGARLGYILQYPQIFIANPASILSRNVELLDTFFGLSCAIIANFIYIQKKKLPLLSVLDALVPMMAVLLIATSLSDLAAGSRYGAPSQLPWAIDLWGTTRHPTQLYMFMISAGLLWIYWPGKTIWATNQPGIYFLSFLASVSGMVIFLEAFRGDSAKLLRGIRLNQAAAWLVLTLSLFAIPKVRSQELTSSPGLNNGDLT